ncbi:MAG: hypothetical protein M1831_005600 [Alyxoria varia]|nr:MAG: hypothetical protein M1831_005600 [Alyxoria varia]
MAEMTKADAEVEDGEPEMETYTVESAVRTFFEKTSVTREFCDAFARDTLGVASVERIPIQGAFSYTVRASADDAGSKKGDEDVIEEGVTPTFKPDATATTIVQFRQNQSRLDMGVTKRAKEIHGRMAAETTYLRDVGDEGAPLAAYRIEKLPGVTHLEFRCGEDDFQAAKRVKTVEDLARFFADSWRNPEPITQAERATIQARLRDGLSALTLSLPQRFQDSLKGARDDLHKLFAPEYPMVLTHGDMGDLNMLVSPETGHITGIIDWAEAEVLPFGFALYGLQHTVSWSLSDGWHDVEDRAYLEQTFWDHFWEFTERNSGPSGQDFQQTIELAWRVGVLLRHGFYWVLDGTVKKAVNENDKRGLACLDALLPTCKTKRRD